MIWIVLLPFLAIGFAVCFIPLFITYPEEEGWGG